MLKHTRHLEPFALVIYGPELEHLADSDQPVLPRREDVEEVVREDWTPVRVVHRVAGLHKEGFVRLQLLLFLQVLADGLPLVAAVKAYE